MTTLHRNQSLDVLRCIAVLLVVGYHLPYYTLWSRMGWVGVDLFFVLSGFLISGLLFQEYKKTGSLDIKRFLIRRGFKIYPSFYLLVVCAWTLSLFRHSATLGKQVVWSALFAQNYYGGTSYLVLGHTWSLAVEEHFYLLLPPLLMLFIALRRNRDPFRALPLLFLIIAALCLGFRLFTLTPWTQARMTHMRIDSLFAGVTLGYLYHFRPQIFDRLSKHYALILGLALCLPSAFLDLRSRAIETFGLTGLFLGFSLLVAWSVARTPKGLLGSWLCRAGAKIGFYSYSIYLWHTMLVDAFNYYPGLSATKFWIYIATAILAGIALARLVEMPYLALREKRFPCLQAGSPAEVTHAKLVELSTVTAGPA